MSIKFVKSYYCNWRSLKVHYIINHCGHGAGYVLVYYGTGSINVVCAAWMLTVLVVLAVCSLLR
jgi:hypothetical protein